MIEVADYDGPLGSIRVAVTGGRVCGLVFDGGWPRLEAALSRRFGPEMLRAADPANVVGRLRAYFAGDVGALDGIPVDTQGTPFQERVWSAIRRIGAGETRSYGELARAARAGGAVRAVGTACGANPVALIVPCHRVVRAGGALGRYGGGVERKARLLELESRSAAERRGA